MIAWVLIMWQFVTPEMSSETRYPEPVDLIHSTITTRDGLAESIVQSIIQDSSGYMWFGTQNGLNRFDGYQMRTWRHSPGVDGGFMGNTLRFLFVDSKRQVWALTEDGYANRYDAVRDRFDAFLIRNAEGQPARQLAVALELESGRILLHANRPWFVELDPETGAQDIDAFVMDEASQAYIRRNKPEGLWDINLHDLKMDSSGTQWLSTSRGLFMRPASADSFAMVRPVGEAFPFFPDVRRLHIQGDSLIWAGLAGGGFWSYDRRNGFFTGHRLDADSDNWLRNFVLGFDEAPDGTFWLGTRLNGLMRFDPATKSMRRYFVYGADLDQQEISTAFVDRHGVIWAAAFGKGIMKINPTVTAIDRRILNADPVRIPQPQNVLDIHRSRDGALRVATFHEGFYEVDAADRILGHVREVGPGKLPNATIWRTEVDRHDTLFAATSGGLVKRHIREVGFERIPIEGLPGAFSRGLLITRGNRVLGGISSGLVEYDYRAGIFRKLVGEVDDGGRFDSPFILHLMEDRRGRVWISTDRDGVYLWPDVAGNRFIRYLSTEPDPNVRAVRVVEDRSGVIWVCTYNGLFRVDETKGVLVREPLPGADPMMRVNNIFDAGDGSYWLATQTGLHRYTPGAERMVHLLETDGMYARELMYSTHTDDTGRIWIGSFQGILRFHPDRLPVPGARWPIRINGFQLDTGDPVRPDARGQVRLTHLQDAFTLSATNFDYRDPQSQQWFFRLRGSDADWVPAAFGNTTRYTNLIPATYIVDAKVVSRYGFEQVELGLMTVEIVPAFWQTTTFKAAMVMLVIGLLYGLYRYRMHHLDKVRQTREAMLHDLHDDLSSVLASVQFNVGTIGADRSVPAGTVERLQDSARQAVDIMRDLLWTVNPKQDTWEDVTAWCKEFVRMSVDDTVVSVSWRIEGNHARVLPPHVKKQFRLIFKELVTNCARHARASSLRLGLVLEDVLRIEIEDDGVGFDTRAESAGVGLESVTQRLRKLGAEWTLSSARGRGTAWSIRIPLR